VALRVCAVGRVLVLAVCCSEVAGRYVPQRVARAEICCRCGACVPWRYVLGTSAWCAGYRSWGGPDFVWRTGLLDFKSRILG